MKNVFSLKHLARNWDMSIADAYRAVGRLEALNKAAWVYLIYDPANMTAPIAWRYHTQGKPAGQWHVISAVALATPALAKVRPISFGSVKP